MAIRALLFDFDGLLVDTESGRRLAWEELYREYGHELPHDRWATLVGTVGGSFDALAHLQELVASPLDAEALRARRRVRADALCDLEQLRPGVEDYLREARRRGLLVAVVSSGRRAWIERHLERLGHLDGWSCIVSAEDDATRAKPLPVLYLEALASLDLEAREAVAFEDSPHGVAAAKAAGIPCVAVPNAITAPLAFDAADLVLRSLEELPLPELLARFA